MALDFEEIFPIVPKAKKDRYNAAAEKVAASTGSSFLFGEGEPAEAGTTGDVYIDTASGTIYSNNAGEWEVKVQLTVFVAP